MRKTSPIGVRLETDIHSRLQEISSSTGITLGDLVRRAVEDYLAKIDAEGEIKIPVPKRKH